MPFTPVQRKKAQAAFLEQLIAGSSILKACEKLKLPRQSVYDWKRADPEFAAAWEQAYEHGTDLLEHEAQRRAVEGVEKPVTVAGQREIVREFSDTLLIFLLKGRRPSRFRDNHTVEHTGSMEVNTPDVAAAVERFQALTDRAVRAAERAAARADARATDAD